MKNDPVDSLTHSRSQSSKPSRPLKQSPAPGPLGLGRPWGAWLSDDGAHFRVWAPERTTVDVVIERPGHAPIVRPLQKNEEGTFDGIFFDIYAGDLYRYKLDQDAASPDPASRFQPLGVHGPSQIVDTRNFAWEEGSWTGIPLEKLVIYELHVGTFTPEGTFEAIISRLPYLVELGVTALELMPIADFAGSRNWGYDGVALYAPSRCYGTPNDLHRLVDAAHRAGLAVLLDVVYNHFGPDGNYTHLFSPFYMTDRSSNLWGKSLNLDGDHSAFVREFFIQNALQWIQDYHMDGLRLDATHALHDASPQHFLAELMTRVQNTVQHRHVHIMAEDNRNEIRLLKPESQNGMGLTAVWSDDFHHQMRRILAGDSDGYYADFSDRTEELAVTLRQGWFRGTDPRGTALRRFIFFIQNHDQIGNRAAGDRLHQAVDLATYRAASALLLMLPETPLLFMGQEWAATSPFLYFTDHHEVLGEKVKEGRKKEFKSFLEFNTSRSIPDPQDLATFQKSKLNWKERVEEPHQSIAFFYEALLRLRRDELAPIPDGKELTTAAVGASGLLVKRFSIDGKMILLIVQFKKGESLDLSSHLSLTTPEHSWDVLLTSEEKTFCQDPLPPVVHLAGRAPLIEFSRPGAVLLKEHTPHKPHA